MSRINKSQKIKNSIIEILNSFQTPLTADDIYTHVIKRKLKRVSPHSMRFSIDSFKIIFFS
ncbi:MAG: hypothetical protein ACJA01_004021 [Saprospiraceae bacterium]|jgi:hypothetical protein